MAKRTCKTCKRRFEGDKRRFYCSVECRTGKAETPPVLRAVEPDESGEPAIGPTPPRKLTVVEAFTEGTELEQLISLRAHLAMLLAGAAPRDAAALSRQLRDIGKEITALKYAEREEAEDADEAPDEEWDESAI